MMAIRQEDFFENELKKYPALLTLDEVADILRVSRRTAQRLVDRGQLDVRNAGRRKLVTKAELARFLFS